MCLKSLGLTKISRGQLETYLNKNKQYFIYLLQTMMV